MHNNEIFPLPQRKFSAHIHTQWGWAGKTWSQQWLIMHESFHHEMAKTMNDLIFLSAIVSEMFFQFSTLLCTLTLGIYYSNDDKCLAEKILFPFLSPFVSFKLKFHTMKTNFFVNSLPLFVKTSRKFFSTKAKRERENEAKRSISLFNPHWRQWRH